MRFLFWNIRGLGKRSRKRQVREFIADHNLEVVGIQETIKETFTDRELLDLLGNKDFSWKWSAARGRSGGSLWALIKKLLKWRIFAFWSIVSQ
jgi:exonuclease III